MPSSTTLQNNVELAPIRSLDDFLLGSARFQLPKINDLERWSNRVASNLLYYQTNYLILFATIYLIMAILNPIKILCGLIVKSLIIFIFVNIQDHKMYYLGGTLAIGYLLLRWMDAIFLSAFALILPLLGTYVHSSLRLRNIRNKAMNFKETLIPTPMGLFLQSMNITIDNFS